MEKNQFKISPLQFNRYFVTQLNIVANPLFDSSKGTVRQDTDLSVSGNFEKIPDEQGLFQITLNIQLQASSGSNLPYSIVVEIIGLIKSHMTGPDETVEKVVFVNGSSMLYCTAREIIRSVTATGPYSQILMPSITFAEPPKSNQKTPSQTT